VQVPAAPGTTAPGDEDDGITGGAERQGPTIVVTDLDAVDVRERHVERTYRFSSG